MVSIPERLLLNVAAMQAVLATLALAKPASIGYGTTWSALGRRSRLQPATAMKSVVLVFSAIDRTFPRLPLQVAAIAFLATLLATLVVHPAMAQAPGSTRVMIRNPDVAKWAGSRNFFSTSSSEFLCRPLACPAPSKVTARISSSPTRSPDRQALAKYASQNIPAAVEQANLNAASSLAPGRKIERLSSTATEVRGYPTIAQEMRCVGGKEPVYMSKVTMFVKSALVDIASFSPSRETARRNRDLFVGAMQVEDIPLPR